LVENSASEDGGGLYNINAISTIENTIIAFSSSGQGLAHYSSAPVVLTCVDIYGNAGGDWIFPFEDQLGEDGNISVDPMFCYESNPTLPFSLHSTSPCAAENNAECGQIGHFGVGCGYTSTKQVNWGVLKSLY